MKSPIVAALIIIITAGLLSIGAITTILNITNPSGNLFEGIVLFSIGVVLLVVLSIASTLGKVIQVFNDIYTQQVEIQKTVNDFYSRQQPRTIGDILGGLGNSTSVTITDLSSGETASSSDSEPIRGIFDIIQKIRDARQQDDSLENLSIDKLEEKLAQAVKDDKFELAQEIRDIIKNKREQK